MNTSLGRFILFDGIPIIVALAFYPIWQQGSIGIAILTALLNFLAVPFYLLIVCRHFVIEKNISLLIAIPLSLFVNVTGIFIQYWNYSSSLHNIESPDSTSAMMLQIELVVSTIILIIGLLAITYIKLRNKQ